MEVREVLQNFICGVPPSLHPPTHPSAPCVCVLCVCVCLSLYTYIHQIGMGHLSCAMCMLGTGDVAGNMNKQVSTLKDLIF